MEIEHQTPNSDCHVDNVDLDGVTEVSANSCSSMEPTAADISGISLLEQQLDSLKHEGVNHYDPVRFCFVESLVRRAAAQRDNVRQQLVKKAQLSLETYLKARGEARVKSERLIHSLSPVVDDGADSASTAISHLAVQAKEAFQQGDFNKAQQLAQQDEYNARVSENSNNVRSVLAELREYLAEPVMKTGNDGQEDNFTELLAQQNENILGDNRYPVKGALTQNSTRTTLKSSRIYQQFQEKKRADTFIDIAFNETPDNPGPLNPEILAIRLLKEINKLSPEYINHYAGYFETLQWLDKAGS